MKTTYDCSTATSSVLWDLCLNPEGFALGQPVLEDSAFAEEDRMFDLREFCIWEKQ